MSAFQHGLEQCGKAVADLWLSLFGIIALLAFPISGIAASFCVGLLASYMVGPGWLAGVIWIVVAFLFGLFLAIYVWEPHVKVVIGRIAETITKSPS